MGRTVCRASQPYYGDAVTAGPWESIIVSVLAAAVAYWRRFLTLPAAVAAAAFGAAILCFGGWHWGTAVAGTFFVTALLSQRQDRLHSGRTRSGNDARNLKQLLANGALPTVLALLYSGTGQQPLLVAAYLGSVGAVSGDTWASAAAHFSNTEPRLLTSAQRVPAGTPGAVTSTGITLSASAGIVACVLYLATAAIVVGETLAVPEGIVLCVSASAGALAGSLFDSYLGSACQAIYKDAGDRTTDLPTDESGGVNDYVRGWRWLSNDLVNLSNAVAGALTAGLLWLIAAALNVV